MSTSPMTPAGGVHGLRDRLDRVQRELASQRRRADTATTFVLILGLIIIVGGAVVSYYSYKKFNETVNEPRQLVQVMVGPVEEKLPDLRQDLLKQIKTSAPQAAADLSGKVRDELPRLRQRAESYALERMETLMVDHSPFEDQFQTFLSQNKVQLRQAFRQLEKSDKLEPKAMQELEQSMESQLGGNFKQQCRQALDSLYAGKAKLDRLKGGKDLAPDEAMERHLLMIARRFRAERENPQRAGIAMESDIRDEAWMRAMPRKAGPQAPGGNPGAGNQGAPPTAGRPAGVTSRVTGKKP